MEMQTIGLVSARDRKIVAMEMQNVGQVKTDIINGDNGNTKDRTSKNRYHKWQQWKCKR